MYRYNNILYIFHRKDTDMIYTKYLHKFACLSVVFIFQYTVLYCYALSLYVYCYAVNGLYVCMDGNPL